MKVALPEHVVRLVESAYLDCSSLCEALAAGAREGLAEAGPREAEISRLILSQLATGFREKARTFKTTFGAEGEA